MRDWKKAVQAGVIGAAILLQSVLTVNSINAEGASDPAPVINPTGISNGKTVLFDNTHEETAGAADWVIDGGFSDFGQALAGQGYMVKELRKSTPITLTDLQQAQVFVMAEPNVPLKTSEQSAILQYVQNGGSILFIGDHYNADRNLNRWDGSETFNGYRRGAFGNPTKGMNSGEASSAAMQDVTSTDWLMTNFGLRFRYNAIGDVTANIVVSSSESLGITSGVSTVAMHAGATLAIGDTHHAKGIVYVPANPPKWSSAVDQGVYNGGGSAEGPMVAIAKNSLGKAAFIGDSSAVEDATPKYKREDTGATKTTYAGFQEQNDSTLLVNLVNWLAKQESYTSFDGISGFTEDQPTQLLSMETPANSTEPQQEPWSTPPSGYLWYDSSTFKPGSYGYSSGQSGGGGTASFSEMFETGSKTSYTSGNVTLASGSWYFDDALIGNLSTDVKDGTQAARIKSAGAISMNFDVSGSSQVQLSIANFGSDTGATWKLQKSTDGGSTWIDVTSATTCTSTLTQQTITVGATGNVRFKVVVAGTSGSRIDVDDFQIVSAGSGSGSGSGSGTATMSETYESGTKSTYTAGNVTLASGSWYFDDALMGNLSTDVKDGTQAARIKSAGAISMNFDVSGASQVQLSIANFGSDTGATWKLQKSTDGGSTWIDVTSATTCTSTLTQQTITVGATGNVRFKVVVAGTSGSRIDVDDFQVMN